MCRVWGRLYVQGLGHALLLALVLGQDDPAWTGGWPGLAYGSGCDVTDPIVLACMVVLLAGNAWLLRRAWPRGRR